jgi:transposase
MRHFSADRKHSILCECVRYSRTHGFAALARRHSVPGGEDTVAAWYRRWDGTPVSLEEKQGRGRPRLLTSAEVSRHVRPRILAANRNNRAINYTQMLPAVRRATGKSISIRTLQHYGKELGVKFKRVTGRTNRERQRVDMQLSVNDCIYVGC